MLWSVRILLRSDILLLRRKGGSLNSWNGCLSDFHEGILLLHGGVGRRREMTTSSSLASKSYYEILGVNRRATAKQIKDQFYRLSKQHHPDKHQGCQESHRKFQEINEAYSVLIDSQQRLVYDRELRTRLGPMNDHNISRSRSTDDPFFQADQGRTKSNFPRRNVSNRVNSIYEARYARYAIKEEERHRTARSSSVNGQDRSTGSPGAQQEGTPNSLAIEHIRLWQLILLLGCVGFGVHVMRQRRLGS
jgi:hypothetical protein